MSTEQPIPQPDPDRGGRYLRDPETGELIPVTEQEQED